MSSDFAWSLSKAYTLSFVGLYVTMYLSSYKMLVMPKERIKIAETFIYMKTQYFWDMFVSNAGGREGIPQIEVWWQQMKQALEMLLQIVNLKYSWKILLKIIPRVATRRKGP